jgi:hypothetical protein
MGQYYLIVNKTKKEYLYPHVFDDGLKACEILYNGNTLKGLGVLLLKSDSGGGGDLSSQNDDNNKIVGRWVDDEIVIIGDYDSSGLYAEADENYTDISLHVIALLEAEGILTAPELGSWAEEIRSHHKAPYLPDLKKTPDQKKPTKKIKNKKEPLYNFAIEPEV